MSPASSGALEVERYIGACLISSQQSRYKKQNQQQPQQQHYIHQDVIYPATYVDTRYRNQRCATNGTERWAGGMPLISFSNHQQRYGHRNDGQTPLSRLAVHTQGAPLILSNNKYRKNKARNGGGIGVKPELKKQEGCRENSTDTVSVASDESSGSANSDQCLPRIIKPRKRRKKDRKTLPHLARPLSQDGSFSTDSASPDIELANPLPIIPYAPYAYDPIFAQYESLGDISETPKLHHSFEDVQELETDINGNVESSCQCRYCDPSGQIWDIDRSCYSPFLTSPPFQFPDSPKSRSSSLASPPLLSDSLIDSISAFSLEDTWKPTMRSGDLEVSTEIVTSLNGHRDLEIKFFSSASGNNSDKSDTGECFLYNKSFSSDE